MTGNTPIPATRLVTTADLEKFGWARLPKAMGVAVKPIVKRLEDRLAEAEAQIASLRKGLTTVTATAGVRRSFTKAKADPDHPGCTLLVLDDGSAVSAPDARLNSLAGAHPVGRAGMAPLPEIP